MFDLSAIAFSVASEVVKGHGGKLPRSHIHEVSAALLGYGTYAGLLTAGSIDDLEGADHVVLQAEDALGRAQKLMPNDVAAAVVEVATAAMVSSAARTNPNVRVHADFAAFRDDLFDDAQQRVDVSDELGTAFADTNAYVDEVYADDVDFSEPLRDARDAWVATVSGTLSGEQDPERPYHGHEGTFEARYLFDKVDRVGLCIADVEIAAGVDQDSWRDDE
jgi:hypothetical protein